jgi:hypothetical protein
MSTIPTSPTRARRRTHPVARWRAALAVLAMAVAGCATGGLPASGAPAGTEPVPASPVPSAVPGSSAVPMSPSPGQVETPRPTEQPGPPVATLVVAGGAPVGGALGSYVWDGAGSDAPWIVPPPDDAVRARAPFGVTLVPPLAIARWEAAWAPVDVDTAGDPAGSTSGDRMPIAVPGPDRVGTWSLKVSVRFADGNRAVWYWRVEGLP